MKTILILTDNLIDQINGVVTTYKNIETHALHDGFKFIYINPGQYKHIDCPKYNELKLAFPRGLLRHVKELSPDHIHIATEGPIGIYARIIFTKYGIQYNTAYHTKFPEAVKKFIGIPESLTWPLIRWFHQNSFCVLTTTSSMVAELKNHGFRSNVKSWTRGVNRDLFKPIIDKKKYHSDYPVMINVGRVSKEKNLEKFYQLQIPGTKIQIGDGPQLQHYREKYPNVLFVGAKTGSELVEYYQKADVFVFPSNWDTFGIVMIEAMACGTPVAAYPVQGPLDVIEQKITGYMHSDLDKAVQKALTLDRDKVSKFSEKWSWEHAWKMFSDCLVDSNISAIYK